MTTYAGTYTALVTPFHENGKIDEASFYRLIEMQIQAGITGIIPCGTTGESATLKETERQRLIEIAVECVHNKQNGKNRCFVFAGTGSHSTEQTLHYSEQAMKLGVDGLLVVTPYYNKPTKEGLYQHYKTLDAHSSVPILLYNVPGRTGVDMQPDTVLQLERDCKHIIGIKEAFASTDRIGELREKTSPSFTILSGDDAMALPMMAVGAQGVVSVASNVYPQLLVKMTKQALANDFASARLLHAALRPFFHALFVESNPSPVKAALSILSRREKSLPFPDNVRLPLVPASEKTRNMLEKAMDAIASFVA